MSNLLKFFCFCCLATTSNGLRAGFVDIVASADGDVTVIGSFTQVSSNTVFFSSTISGSLQERAITEFNLSSIQSQANTITHASLRLRLSGSVARTFDDFIQLNLRGYQGNGAIDLADYSTPATLLGSKTILESEFGGPVNTIVSFDLDVNYVKQLAANGTFLGIRISQQYDFSQILIRSLESGSTPPTLRLTTTAVPEPSSITLLVTACIALCVRRKRRKV